MKWTNKHNLPQPIADAVIARSYGYDGKKFDFTATGLLKPAQIVVLEERHWDEIVMDVLDAWWSLWGSAMHTLLQHHTARDVIAEERFSHSIDVDYDGDIVTQSIGGKPDLVLDVEGGTIYDYKTTSVWSYIFERNLTEWSIQLSIYAWLLEVLGIMQVKKLIAVPMYRDWHKRQAKFKNNYPTFPILQIQVDRISTESIIEWIQTRIKLVQECRKLPDSELTKCTAEERWERPAKYRVRLSKKKASKILATTDTKDGAEYAFSELKKELDEQIKKGITSEKKKDYYKNAYIEFTKGESPRCTDYCAAQPFCCQFKEVKENLGL